MTQSESNPRIDAMLRALPREIEPERDLWPAIEAGLESRSMRRWSAWAWQAAAAVVLVAASSLITASLLRRDETQTARNAAPATEAPAVHAAFGQPSGLGAGYESARRELATDLAQRMSSMPASARQKLVANLAEMRRAADEINAALARQPGDPLLEELLLNTYQDELGVIASVNQLTRTGATSIPARQENIRL
jgi:hypothetical protein